METWTPTKIKSLRETFNLYQRDLADLVGVTSNYIHLLEKGVKKPSRTLSILLERIEKELRENEKGKESDEHGKRDLQKR